MRLSLAKKITSENVEASVQPAMNILAGILNSFMEDVTTVINGNIDFDNLTLKVTKFEVIVDSQGLVKSAPEINIGITRQLNALVCVNVTDGSNSAIIPDISTTPTVFFNTLGGGRVKVTKVLNLKENKKYILTLLAL